MSWWHCESTDAFYNLSTISKILFCDPYDGVYKIQMFSHDNEIAFTFTYDSDYSTYRKEKSEIMELMGMDC